MTWGENYRGTNRINRIMNSAVVQENFEGDGYRGMSVSVFSKEDSRWHQTWVDCSGAYLEIVGDFADGRMILTRNGIVDGETVEQRMIWYDITKDKFLWNWVRSNDNGTVEGHLENTIQSQDSIHFIIFTHPAKLEISKLQVRLKCPHIP